MAWNEPGGKKPNDPWKPKKDQGPPDLDELLKKITGGFSGGPSGGAPKGLFLGLAVVGVLLFALSGIYTVEQAERAIVLQFGKYDREEVAGLKWRIPIVEQVLKVDVDEIQGYDHSAHMITKDQNIVDVGLNVQFRVNNARDYFLAIKDPAGSLQHATSSALRHVVGGERMDSVLTDGREKIASDVQVRLQEYLDEYKTGLFVTKVNIENTQPPSDSVIKAFKDVIRAKEDKERFIQVAQRYSKKIILEARGAAKRIMEEAQGYKAEIIAESTGDADRFSRVLEEYAKAPDVTRRRLYIETMEEVYGDNPKIMLDVKSGGNLMYLPIDKLMSMANESQSQAGREDLRPSRNQSRSNSIGMTPLDPISVTAKSTSTREGR